MNKTKCQGGLLDIPHYNISIVVLAFYDFLVYNYFLNVEDMKKGTIGSDHDSP